MALGIIHIWRPYKNWIFASLSTSIHIRLPPPPLWTSTHRQHKVHIYLPNLMAGTMTLHAHEGITSHDKIMQAESEAPRDI